jgi:RNA polymerase sigma-70 factor (ECF subfamily)
MSHTESTCWTIIQAAAAGSSTERDDFARRYGPVIRAYLAQRWRGSPCLGQLDDAVQDVFVECFKPGGVLECADRDRGFRPFLYGVVRHVALRLEHERGSRRRQAPADLDIAAVPDDEASLSQAFDRAWARALLREAAERMRQRARAEGEAAVRRVDLLHLRFHEGKPIRDIAAMWQVEPARLHHEYARAREEFRAALRAVVAFHHPGGPADLDKQCTNLLSLLG